MLIKKVLMAEPVIYANTYQFLGKTGYLKILGKKRSPGWLRKSDR
ncbi:MAG: hypothetical protein O4751_00015 [Trichodesmium sp. St2_bin6]|nr:hypothetical protein [Trichodesmium sp. St2_bin6]